MRTRETARKATSSPSKRLVDSFLNMQVNADDNIMRRCVTGSPKPQVTPLTRPCQRAPMTPTGDTQPNTCQRMPKPQVRTNDTRNPQLSAAPRGQHPPYVVGGAWTGCVTRPSNRGEGASKSLEASPMNRREMSRSRPRNETAFCPIGIVETLRGLW